MSLVLMRGRLVMACALLGWVIAAGFAVAQVPAARAPFDAEAHPAAPDYRLHLAWAALPGVPGPGAQVPAGAAPAADPRRARADVFYVHPTTELSAAHWNQDLAETATNDWTDTSVIARQASVFNSCCRLYAPRYRQAGPGAIGSHDGSGDKAFDLAYGDVKRAFEYYLAHDNHGRPFILAGHSQGSLHIYRLIAEMIDGKPLQRRFVAAYTPGVPVALGEFGRRFKSIGPCARPADIACIASWNGFETIGDPAAYRRGAMAKYTASYSDGDATPLCVNPLTFDLDRPAAAAPLNDGALPGLPSHDPLPALIPAAVGATCDVGILRIDEPASAAFQLHRLPAGSLHYHEIDLFYASIRSNAALRVNAWWSLQR